MGIDRICTPTWWRCTSTLINLTFPSYSFAVCGERTHGEKQKQWGEKVITTDSAFVVDRFGVGALSHP